MLIVNLLAYSATVLNLKFTALSLPNSKKVSLFVGVLEILNMGFLMIKNLTSKPDLVGLQAEYGLSLVNPARSLGLVIMLFNLIWKVDEYLKGTTFDYVNLFYNIPVKPTFSRIPYPNYTLGMLGYYGMALFTNSYTILFLALSQHLKHILFLWFIYRPLLKSESEDDIRDYHKAMHVYSNQDMVIFYNMDLFRSGDAVTAFIMIYTITTAIVIGPIQTSYHFYFYLSQAIFWRICYTYILGIVLYTQRKSKFWTRYFLRRGDGVIEAFQHWKLLSNLSLLLTYTSFYILAYRLYTTPTFTTTDGELLRHIIGILMVILHAWVNISVYQVVGPLLWFHGEFFIDTLPPPSTRGIFKYADYPLLYQFSLWGVALLCERKEILGMAIFSQLSQYLFLVIVKGSEEVGLRRTTSFSSDSDSTNVFTPDEDEEYFSMTISRVVKELEGLVTTAKPAVEMIVQKTRRGVVKLAESARLEGSLPVQALPIELYSLGIEWDDPLERIRVPYGEPIRVEFVGCRETMKRKDWVGIYEIGANFDETITTSTCGSRWGYLAGEIQPSQDPSNPDGRLFTRTKTRQLYFGSTPVTLTKSVIPGLRLVNGKITFDKMMLPWKTGVYEFRYHHDGKYNVVATSIPFEIYLPEKRCIKSPSDIVDQLLPVVKRCLDLGTEELRADEGMLRRLPTSPQNGNYQRQVSERIVYAIKSIYNVDFSWKAIDNLYSLENLAERVRGFGLMFLGT